MEFIRNDNAATVLQGTNLQDTRASTTSKGEVFITSASGGTASSTIPVQTFPKSAATATQLSLDTSFGSVTTHTSKATPAVLISFTCSSVNAAIRYFMLFNITSAPTTGTTVPLMSFPIGAGSATVPSSLSRDATFFAEYGFLFATGLTWGVSSVAGTYTSTGVNASDHIVHVIYE